MSVRRIRAIGGLATDPGALENPEALRVAQNVMLHRPGIIQPRIGLGDVSEIASRSTDYRPIAIVTFDGHLIIQSYDGASYRLEKGTPATVYNGTVIPPDEEVRAVASFAEARGSLYLTTSAGVKKLTSADASALLPSGVVNDYALPFLGAPLTATTDRYALANDSHVAYRYVWKNVDTNGYVRRSAPSPRFSISNSDANKYYVPFGRIYLPEGIAAGDVLEVYRTTNATPYTSDPGDEMFLAVTHTVTSAEATAGFITGSLGVDSDTTIIDTTPDALLGAALYTNVSQGGLLQSNERPPLANHLALWSRCMWFGGTSERRTLLVEPRCVYDVATAKAHTWRDGIHYSNNRTATLSTSVNLAAVSRIDGAKVGQYITSVALQPSDASTNFQALTKVASITTTITIVSNAAIDTAVPDKLTFRGIPGVAGDEWSEIEWDATLTSIGLAQKGANATASAVNLASAINQTFDGRRADITATANSNTVTIVDNDGHGVPVELTEVTPGTLTVAYSMTVDKATLTTGAGVAISLHDYVTIGGTEFFFSLRGPSLDDPTGTLTASFSAVSKKLIALDNARSGSEDLEFQCKKLVREFAETMNAYGIYNGGISIRAYADNVESSESVLAGHFSRDNSTSPSALILLRENPGESEISGAYAPARPGGGIRFEQDFGAQTRPGRLWFSKPDEPEAVPPANFIDVGNVNERIIATTPMRNALLVWKKDGLFRITGNAPDSWVVDEIDTTLRLLSSQCVCLMNGVAYAFTDRGVVATTEIGAQVISLDIATDLRDAQRELPDDAGDKRSFWMVPHPRMRAIILGVGVDDSTLTTNQYVYFVDTRRWATWPRVDRCATYDRVTDKLVVSPGVSAWSVVHEWTDETDSASIYFDYQLTALSCTVSGSTVTIAIADFAPHVPVVGDVIETSSVYRRITAVSSGGGNYTITVDSTGLSGTSCTWYQSYNVSLMWHAQNLPGSGARWGEMHAHYQGFSTATVASVPLLLGGQTERDTSASTVSYTMTALTSPRASLARVGPPRDVVRAARMYPSLSTRAAGMLWHLEALDLHFDNTSRRVAR